MRFRWSIILVAAAAPLGAIHCVGDAPPAGVVNDDGGASDDGGALGDAASGDGSAIADGATGIDVDGTLQLGQPPTPITNRDVVLIDATDTVFKLTSGADGKFHASGVQAPYDVFVPYVQPDGGPLSYPYYFGGLTRTDPVLFAMPYDGSGPPQDDTPRSAPITFKYNACSGCTIWISGPSDGSRTGGMGALFTYTSFSYRWFGAPTRTTNLHFFFQDATGAFTSHEDVSTFTLTDTVPKDLGTISSGDTIAANPTVSVSAALPGGYTYDHTSYTYYAADGSRIAYADADTASSSTKLPAVANVKININASSEGPNGASSDAYVSYPDYSSVPASIALTLPAAPTVLTPAAGATGVTASQKLTWTPATSPGVYYAEIGENSGIDASFYLMSPEIDLARLAKVGITLASGHTYSFHVAVGSPVSVDEATKPGGSTPAATGVVGYTTRSGYQTFTMQ